MTAIILLCAMVAGPSQVETVQNQHSELLVKADEARAQAKGLQVQIDKIRVQCKNAIENAPMLLVFVAVCLLGMMLAQDAQSSGRFYLSVYKTDAAPLYSINSAEDLRRAVDFTRIQWRICTGITALSFVGMIWYAARFSGFF